MTILTSLSILLSSGGGLMDREIRESVGLGLSQTTQCPPSAVPYELAAKR